MGTYLPRNGYFFSNSWVLVRAYENEAATTQRAAATSCKLKLYFSCFTFASVVEHCSKQDARSNVYLRPRSNLDQHVPLILLHKSAITRRSVPTEQTALDDQ